MAADTKVVVINLYKRLIKLAKNWQAKEPSQTSVERADILREVREKFRFNRELTDPAEIYKLIHYANKRIVQAEHYGIAYERLEYMSTPREKRITNLAELRENKQVMVPSTRSQICQQFARYYYSGTKLDDSLIEEIAVHPDFSFVAESVLNNAVLKEYPLRSSYKRQLFKEFLKYVSAENSDLLYNSMADSLVDQYDHSHRLYCDHKGYLLCKVQEVNKQLCYGTTGLSIWQSSCDLANLLYSFFDLNGKKVIELGSGCGFVGISLASSTSNCKVILTDYDTKVLAQLQHNVDTNFNSTKDIFVEVAHLDWAHWSKEHFSNVDVVLAADVVYDRKLFPYLCNTIYELLEKEDSFAIIASTLRDETTLTSFREELDRHMLLIKDECQFFHGYYKFNDGFRVNHQRLFPFFSTLDASTVFYYIVRV